MRLWQIVGVVLIAFCAYMATEASEREKARDMEKIAEMVAKKLQENRNER